MTLLTPLAMLAPDAAGLSVGPSKIPAALGLRVFAGAGPGVVIVRRDLRFGTCLSSRSGAKRRRGTGRESSALLFGHRRGIRDAELLEVRLVFLWIVVVLRELGSEAVHGVLVEREHG